MKLNCEKCGKPIEVANWEYFEWRKAVYYCSGCFDKYNREENEKYEKSKRVIKKDCSSCNGTGCIKGYKCMNCNGRGRVTYTTHDYQINYFFSLGKGKDI